MFTVTSKAVLEVKDEETVKRHLNPDSFIALTQPEGAYRQKVYLKTAGRTQAEAETNGRYQRARLARAGYLFLEI